MSAIHADSEELESSVDWALISLPTLLCASRKSNSERISELDAHVSAAASRLTASTTSVITTVCQSVPAFASAARAHCDAVEKLLAMEADELDDTRKVLEMCLHQLASSDGSIASACDSSDVLMRLLSDNEMLPDVSAALTSMSASVITPLLARASHIGIGVDPQLCDVNHDRWLTRGTCNDVWINLVNEAGQPFLGATLSDVHVAFSEGTVGWSLNTVSVSSWSTVTSNVVLKIDLAADPDCSDSAQLTVSVGGDILTIPLEVCLSCGVCTCICPCPHAMHVLVGRWYLTTTFVQDSKEVVSAPYVRLRVYP